jgi:hypothetical protein
VGGTRGFIGVGLSEMIEHRAQVVGFPVEPPQVLDPSGSVDAMRAAASSTASGRSSVEWCDNSGKTRPRR